MEGTDHDQDEREALAITDMKIYPSMYPGPEWDSS